MPIRCPSCTTGKHPMRKRCISRIASIVSVSGPTDLTSVRMILNTGVSLVEPPDERKRITER